jgi:hypothetical protein
LVGGTFRAYARFFRGLGVFLSASATSYPTEGGVAPSAGFEGPAVRLVRTEARLCFGSFSLIFSSL